MAAPSDAASPAADTVDILMQQFQALRAEILERSKAQLALISLNITALGVVGGTFLSNVVDPRVLFVVPILSPILGLIYLDHALAIGNMGRFIENTLIPRIASLLRQPDLPDYEQYVRQLESRHDERIVLLWVPIAALFAILPGVALVLPLFLTKSPFCDPVVWPFLIAGVMLLAIFLWFSLLYITNSPRIWPRASTRQQGSD
jgi:hypothetical protein